MHEEIDEAAQDIERSPTEMLALDRTVLANERTFLSFVRTATGLFATGIGLIKFLDSKTLEIFGFFLVFAAGVNLVFGARRYIHVKRILKKVREDVADHFGCK